VAVSKDAVIEAFVLCTRKLLGTVLPPDALRATLNNEYDDLVQNGTFNTERFWLFLEEQPDMDPRAAAAPLCAFALLEDKLGIKVRLPEPVAKLGAPEREKLASLAGVRQADVDRVLQPPEPRSAPPAVGRTTGSMSAVTLRAREEEQRERERRGREKAGKWSPTPTREPLTGAKKVAAAVVSLVVIVASGFWIAGQVASNMARTAKGQPIDPRSFAGAIPLSGAEQFTREVHATLAGSAWMSAPEDVRREQLLAALATLQTSTNGQVIKLVILDGKTVRAVVFRSGRNPSLPPQTAFF